MKKLLTFLLLVICFCGLVGCRTKSTSQVKIDYGNSTLYSEEDMNEAIKVIKKEFATWDGCELHSISYSSDAESNNADNIKWINEIKESNDAKITFTQCIMFKSNFHSPKKGGGSWDPDKEYTDWSWWLARSNDGQWKLITWGYC